MFTRKEAADLLGISMSTFRRRIVAGTYQCHRTEGTRLGENCMFFTYADLGLPEPVVPVVPDVQIAAQYEDDPPVYAEPVDPQTLRDSEFARAYLANEVTDSSGNYIDGTNRRWPNKRVSLLGPTDDLDFANFKADRQSHMDPRLLSDFNDGNQHDFSGLASGLSPETYAQMMNDWRRSRGGPSMSEQREASERSRQMIRTSFPKAQRT